MAKTKQRRFARLRRVFRWCRIFVLLVVLAAVVGGIYLNEIGLPNFLKRPLLARLHDEGVQLDFSRMRLRWYRGIVADDAKFTLLKIPAHPKFSSAQAELNLDVHALLASKFQVNSVAVKNGNFIWPIAQTNLSALSFSNITARIQFLPNDEIHFTELRGDFANTQIEISGTLTNASAMRAWKFPSAKKKGKGKGGGFINTLAKIHFSGAPELKFEINGDAAEPKTLRGSLQFIAGRAESPWLTAQNLQLTTEIRDWINEPFNNFARVKMDFIETRWGSASNFTGVVKLLSSPTNSVFESDIKFSAKQIRSKTGSAAAIQFAGRASHSLTNWKPNEIHGKANLNGAETKWGKTESAQIVFSAATNGVSKIADADWGEWKKIKPYRLNWESQFSGIEMPKFKIETLSSTGSWNAPQLVISNLNARLPGGGIQATSTLNVASREIAIKGVSDFDPKKLAPLLSTNLQNWMTNFVWETSPHVETSLRATLSSWTNATTDWRKEVLPTLVLDGAFSVGKGSFRGIEIVSAKSDFWFANEIWMLPHFRIERPEGGADLNLVANEITHNFQAVVHSDLDPKFVRSLLTKKARRVVDDFQFSSPPTIRADVRGDWKDWKSISGSGEIALKDFSYRSNHIDLVTTSLQVTNRQLNLSQSRLDAAQKFVTADAITLNFQNERMTFKNIHSTVDPYVVTGLIGKKTLAAIAPYRFSEPPTVSLNGGLTIGKVSDADLHFQIDGTQFRWKELSAQKLSGRVDWVGKALVLTNIQGTIYDGTGTGWATFHFIPHHGADYRFEAAVADVDLRSVVKSVGGKAKKIEGMLHGELTVDSGNTTDTKTMVGRGRVNVRDGLLWDVPLFGIFSPMLNAILPGAGNSRAREASATFEVNNGMIYTDDLEIRAATLRMLYRGGVDFDEHIEARVEAEPLRDAWIVGRLMSLALSPLSKLFEFKVTGTLAHPETEPVYIPNFLMMTLRPFHTIKKALTPDKPAAIETEPAPAPSPETPK